MWESPAIAVRVCAAWARVYERIYPYSELVRVESAGGDHPSSGESSAHARGRASSYWPLAREDLEKRIAGRRRCGELYNLKA